MRIDRRKFSALALSSLVPASAAGRDTLTFCCSSSNDVYRALRREGVKRYETVVDALARAPEGSGVLLMADQYPKQTLSLPTDWPARASERKLRVYVEFAGTGETKEATWERAVVSSSFFGKGLLEKRILSPHNCRFVAVDGASAGVKTHLVLARVAGYDKAVFGIPEKGTHPLLVEQGNVLAAASQLSRFVTARYAPSEAWLSVWRGILAWVMGGAAVNLESARVVLPALGPSVRLANDAELQAFTRGVEWYSNARLFVHPSWEKRVDEARQYKDQVGPGPGTVAVGDGSLGMLEGHDARISPDGSQNLRWWIRADCVGETSMVYSLAHKVTKKPEQGRIAANLIDYLLHRSKMASGSRMDPQSVSYGLIGWNNTPKYHEGEDGYDVYYGDDNARCLLGMLATMALTGESKWMERFWLAVLGNFRLVGRLGHQKARYDQAPLEKTGWQHYFRADTILHDMNYEAYPWALFLWAAARTRWAPFFDRVEKGIRLTMEAYPAKWRWSNSITSHQARILLPLAWLIKVRDTPEYREWLRRVTSDLLERMHASGAIREWTGPRETGIQMPPAKNEDYGTGEGTLTQTNGDPATDLLYTMNFAFIGWHEAHAATGEQGYKDAENRVAEFLVRAQARSQLRPEFNGAWFRAFDFEKWDYWASNSDSGWGAWCTESGWSQSWITTTFALRLLKRSLWDVMAEAPQFAGFARLRELMFPPSVKL
jgi:hypothetical protein